MKMKITDQYIRSNLIFYLKYILVYLYKLKTTKDNDFWFKEYGYILSINTDFYTVCGWGSKFRNFKIANIKITKDELIDSFIFEFIFSFWKII